MHSKHYNGLSNQLSNVEDHNLYLQLPEMYAGSTILRLLILVDGGHVPSTLGLPISKHGCLQSRSVDTDLLNCLLTVFTLYPLL